MIDATAGCILMSKIEEEAYNLIEEIKDQPFLHRLPPPSKIKLGVNIREYASCTTKTR